MYIFNAGVALIRIKEKSQNISTKVNKITGVLLIVIAVFQAVKLYAI